MISRCHKELFLTSLMAIQSSQELLHASKEWKTPSFNIKRSVFQGDTLSPLIFLLTFNPLIEVCHSLSCCGFSLKLPVPNSSGIPPVQSLFIGMNHNLTNHQGHFVTISPALTKQACATNLEKTVLTAT